MCKLYQISVTAMISRDRAKTIRHQVCVNCAGISTQYDNSAHRNGCIQHTPCIRSNHSALKAPIHAQQLSNQLGRLLPAAEWENPYTELVILNPSMECAKSSYHMTTEGPIPLNWLWLGVGFPAQDNEPWIRFRGNETYYYDMPASICPFNVITFNIWYLLAHLRFVNNFYFYYSIKSSLPSWGRLVVCRTTSVTGKEKVVKRRTSC